MRRSERRAARIREEIPIEAVLAAYGYAVAHHGDRREQQFSCDLHGDGRDSKPSARCYPDSNQWYCWACYTSRDAVATVREKEGVSFPRALELLEQRYRLPPLPWGDEDEEEREAGGGETTAGLEEALRRPPPEPGRELARVKVLLQAASTEKELPLPVLASYWEQYDYLRNLLDSGVSGWEEGVWELRAALVNPRGGSG